MQSARAIFAELAIPAITIARDPSVQMLRDEMNPGNKKQPGD